MRLRPLTSTRPKPLMRVGDRSLLDIMLERLSLYGVKEAAITLGYRGDDIIHEIGEEAYGIKLTYFTEDTPLGTAGSVKNCEDFLGEDTLILSADALTEINFGDMLCFHRDKGARLTIATAERNNLSLYGVIEAGEDGRVTSLKEKPPLPDHLRGLISCGIYIIKKEIMEGVPRGQTCDFARDLFPRLIGEGGVFSYRTDEFWCDVGSFDEYKRSNLLTLTGDFFVSTEKYPLPDGSVSKSVIGRGTRVLKKARVVESVVGRNVRIGEGALLDGCILGDGVTIGDGVRVSRGAVIGDFATLPDGTIVAPDTRVEAYGGLMSE